METYGSVVKCRKDGEVFEATVIDFLYVIGDRIINEFDNPQHVTGRLTVVRKEDGTVENLKHSQIAKIIRR